MPPALPDSLAKLLLERSDGTPRRLEAAVLDCLWYSGLGQRLVRVVAAREPDRPDRVLLAVLSTDLELSAAEILSRYLERWAIQVAFQEAKGQLGVGEAHNRVQPAVERTVPFGFPCQTLRCSGTRSTASPTRWTWPGADAGALVSLEARPGVPRQARRPAPRADPGRVSGRQLNRRSRSKSRRLRSTQAEAAG
jgi:hypothetical protein